jgi:hypothetical protein
MLSALARHLRAQLPYEAVAFRGYRAHLYLRAPDALGVAPRARSFEIRLDLAKLYRQKIELFSCGGLHCLSPISREHG